MKKWTVGVTSVLALSLLVPSAASAIDYTQVFAGTTTGAGTINLGNPHGSIFTVTSKFNQPRNVNGTNPHRGTDLGSAYGEPVYASWNGWVTYTAIGSYDLIVYLDLNNDGLKNDNAYIKYDHISAIYVSSGAAITKGQKIAAVGNEGGVYPAHLHFGVMKDAGTDGTPDYWVRNEPYYRTVASWDYGKMLDFISYSTYNSNTASVYAYAHDETGKQTVNAGDVTIFHRKAGTATWTAATATKSGDQFTYNFTGVYPAGTSIQWMARANRSSIKATASMYWAFHNPKFAQPDYNPNATAYTYDYFTNTVQ